MRRIKEKNRTLEFEGGEEKEKKKEIERLSKEGLEGEGKLKEKADTKG